MRFVCDSCRAQYMISDEKVGAKGVKVRCKKCGFVILVRKTAQAQAQVPTPSPAPTDDGVDATQVMQNPLASASGPAGASGESHDPDVTAPGVVSPNVMAQAAGVPSGKSGSGLFAGVEEDEIGAVFDQVLQSGSHKVVADGTDAGGAALGDESPDDRLSTRVLDVETVRKLAEETAQAEAGGQGAHANGKNGKAHAAAEPEKHDWFVAIDDKQVGPLTLEKVKAHWDSGEIGPDSLCWRAGFGDWLPLSEVTELASVLAPQPKKPVIVGSGEDAPTGQSPSVVTVPVESAFSAGGVTRTVRSEVPVVASASPSAAADAGGWKPSAASALASLVKEEIEALARPPEPEVKAKPAATEDKAPKAAKDEGVKGLLDLPSAEHSVPEEPAPAASRAAAPRLDPSPLPRNDTQDFQRAPVGAAPYQTAYRPQSSGIPRPVLIGGGVVLALLVVLVVAVVALAFGKDSEQTQVAQPLQPAQPLAVAQATTPSAPAQGDAAGAAAATEPARTEPAKAEPAEGAKAEDTQPASAEAKEEPKDEPKKAEPKSEPAKVTRRDPVPARSDPKPEPRRTPAREEKPEPKVETTTPAEAADDFDAVFGGGSSPKASGSTRGGSKAPAKNNDSVYIPPAPGSATVPERLGQSDIMAVVLRNKGAIQRCVNEQKDKDPGTSGRLVMRWSIRTNGRTEKINVQTAEFRSTHVATCIGGLIKGWRFPEHKVQGDPIDFPFIF